MGSSSPETVSTRLQRIAKLAREAPEMVLTTLAHHIDLAFLREAYRRTRKDAAPGVDGMVATKYAYDLDRNLEALLDRFKSGTYKAPPVKRVQIPKGEGRKTRPIGVPTFEDKVLQRAVKMVLEAVYEESFLDCSYGFRPSRSAHQALQRVWGDLMAVGGGWVLEVDIASFFDELDHSHLREFLDQRVCDGVLRRVIDKWLKAGVLTEGVVHFPSSGTPQGGVISPLLANVYLHEVLDCWFYRDVIPRLRGRASLVRYADDAILVFECEDDAKRVRTVLDKRMERYGLRLHQEKTRLVDFRSPGRRRPRDADGSWRPGTFALLGFTHFWAQTRRRTWVVKRKTASNRLSAALQRVRRWCRFNRHLPIEQQQQMLRKKLLGHYGYYGITGNVRALQRFFFELRNTWQFWLNRRSQRAQMNWDRFERLLSRYPLPPPRVTQSIYRRVAKSVY